MHTILVILLGNFSSDILKLNYNVTIFTEGSHPMNLPRAPDGIVTPLPVYIVHMA